MIARIRQRVRDANRVRRRRMVRLGCMPAALLVTLGSIVFVVVFALARAPAGFSSPRTYLIEGRLTLSIVIIAVMQFISVWVLGLMSAQYGTTTVAGQGGWFVKRFRIVKRQLLLPTLTVVLLRLLLVGVVALALAHALVGVFGDTVDIELLEPFLDEVYHYFGLGSIGMLTLAALYMVVTPFLRMRMSVLLGALAATLTTSYSDRAAAALNVRLGFGLILALLYLWGVGSLLMGAVVINDPLSFASYRFYYDWPLPRTGEGLALAFVLGVPVVLSVLLALQVALVVALRALIPQRLARRAAAVRPRPWLETVEEGTPA